MLMYPVSHRLVDYMATDAKCSEIVFEVCKLTTATKKSALAIPHYHPESGNNGKLN